MVQTFTLQALQASTNHVFNSHGSGKGGYVRVRALGEGVPEPECRCVFEITSPADQYYWSQSLQSRLAHYLLKVRFFAAGVIYLRQLSSRYSHLVVWTRPTAR